jgi:putative NADH-flavin reductase
MKLLVLGATGPLGQRIVAQALEQGHEVTAFARSPQKLRLEHDHLRIARGDVLDGSGSVEAAVKGQEAVISALGVGRSFKSGGLIARSMPVIVQAMERQQVGRLIFTSGIIVKLDSVPFVMRVLLRLLQRDLMIDKKAGEDILRTSALDWTLVYPTALTNGPKTGRYRFGEQVELRGLPTVSRSDVADLILKQLSEAASIRKDIIVSN